MIKYITLDLWETLIADSPELDGRRTDFRVNNIYHKLKKIVPGLDISRVAEAHKQTWQVCSESWKRAKDLSFDEQVRLFLSLVDSSMPSILRSGDFRDISDIYSGAVLEFRPKMIEGTRETLADLKARDCKIGLICNTGRSPGFILRQLLIEYGILAFFDSMLFSDETIVRKPVAAIFDMSVRELGAIKEQTLHAGDSWENDILGASNAGLKAVWISGESSGLTDCPVIKSIAELPAVIDSL